MSILIIIFYLYMLLLPFIGFLQIIDSICQYNTANMPEAFYKAIRQYFNIVGFYFFGGILYFLLGLVFPLIYNSYLGEIFVFAYFIIVPSFIAGYYLNLLQREYIEELEKLIF